MHSKLLTVILKKVQLSNDDIQFITDSFHKISIKKNTFLKKEKEVANTLFFIDTGYARVFHVNKDGIDITTSLNSPLDYTTSFLAFVNQENSEEIIETVSDCLLLSITYSSMRKLIDNSESFKKYSVSIFEDAIKKTQHRANDLVTLSAEERYLKLIKQEPEIIKNFPLNYIASYLGVAPESLSRIRRKVIS